jgi:uncharacterized protein (TIGR03435 family)
MLRSFLIGLFPAALIAQVAAPPTFEVVSIKPSQPGTRNTNLNRSPGGFTARNATLKLLTTFAYHVQNHQLSGTPGWFDSDAFDLAAKADVDLTDEQARLALQTVLKERFKLMIHRESKTLPAYALVVGKNGPKIKHSQTSGGPSLSFPKGKITGQRVPMARLAEVLSFRLNGPVVDRTELEGVFDVKLEWTDQTDLSPGAEKGPGVPADGKVVGPSVFTAIQEQLGLKLQAEKLPVEIIVVDSVERVPTEN